MGQRDIYWYRCRCCSFPFSFLSPTVYYCWKKLCVYARASASGPVFIDIIGLGIAEAAAGVGVGSQVSTIINQLTVD